MEYFGCELALDGGLGPYLAATVCKYSKSIPRDVDQAYLITIVKKYIGSGEAIHSNVATFINYWDSNRCSQSHRKNIHEC